MAATITNNYTYPENEIVSVEFYIMGSDDHKLNSSCNITSKDLFSNERPIDNGIYSLNMGTTSYSYRCKTCLNPRDKCLGHFGSIRLNYPVTNTLFRNEIPKWLKVICHNCGNAITNLSEDISLSKAVNIAKSITSKNLTCKTCGFNQPQVLKDPKEPLFLITKNSDDEEKRLYYDEIEAIFSRVSNETVLKLNKTIAQHPSKFILRTVPAIPNNARPDVRKMKGGSRSNNNDTTTFIKHIVSTNENISPIIKPEDKASHETILNLLEIAFHSMIKETPNSSSSSKLIGGNGQSLASISTRLRGKEGRIRGNLEGKRIQYGGRSVISGDNNIKIDVVGVPMTIAKTLQIPEIVRPYNIDRLTTCFLNKNLAYPGCSKIIKASSGESYHIDAYDDNLKLEFGDILFRDMIDGDDVAMNRAPSLLYSAISGQKAKILKNGDTFRLSVNIADTLYGGDFDGDAMSIYPPHSIITRNECGTLSHLKRWFISYKDRSPAMGIYHDNLIGTFELTKNNMYVDKYHAMCLLSQVEYDAYLHKFKPLDDIEIGRDLFSKLLPEINFSKKSSFYKPEYSGFIKYDKNETHVEIKRGKIISGRLDKKSVGQGVNDSLFHNVYNAYGVNVAMDLLYNMQQVSTNYLLMRGYTINYDDIAIKKDILKKINDITASILYESDNLTKKLRAGLITPPIGMTVDEYYEQEQINILSPGDDFTEVVMSSLNHENNNLYKLVASGTKGKPTNILQISSSIGQMSIKGNRMKKTFDFGRAIPYFKRFHDEPQAVGFIPDSYVTGVSSLSAIAQQQDGRNGITTKALSTGVTGYHNRKCNKNVEAVIIDNLRRTTKYDLIIQHLYGDDGVDIRKVAYVNMDILLASDADFNEKFAVTVKDLPPSLNTSTAKAILEDSLTELYKDREFYRSGLCKLESCNFKESQLSGQQVLPVNIDKIIDDIAYNHSNYIAENKTYVTPIEWKSKISELKERLLYCHYNEIQYKNKYTIPWHIKNSFNLFNISINVSLSYKKLMKLGFDLKLIDLTIEKICNMFKTSLVEYGTSIGMIASECTSESMTQKILDSIHSSGTSKGNFLSTIKEVYGGKTTAQMAAPYMNIFIKSEYEDDLSKIQEIANDIEMMDLVKFVDRAQIFFEEYKKIEHPGYKHEITAIFDVFEKHNINMHIPSNLIKWCIRLEFNHETMIEKNMQIATIYRKIKKQFPMLFIVYTDDNTEHIIMRIYMQKDLFKKESVINQFTVKEFLHTKLLKIIIRGIIGITSASVKKNFVPRSIVSEDGSIKVIRKHIIQTTGTNLSDITNNKYIDTSKTTSNSIFEIYELYGIHAAKMMFIQRLRELSGSDINIKHYMLIADVLTFNGYISNIEKSGLSADNTDNALLSISYSHPLQTIADAALNNDHSLVNTNISSSLMMGTTPNLGSNYNSITINEKFINENKVDVANLIDNM